MVLLSFSFVACHDPRFACAHCVILSTIYCNREVLQTESGSIFGKVCVRVLTGQGQSTNKHVRTESLFCKQKIDFRFHFRFGQFSGDATGDFQEDCGGNPVSLESQSDKLALAEEERLFYLGLRCKAVQGGSDNQPGSSSRTVLHEGE